MIRLCIPTPCFQIASAICGRAQGRSREVIDRRNCNLVRAQVVFPDCDYHLNLLPDALVDSIRATIIGPVVDIRKGIIEAGEFGSEVGVVFQCLGIKDDPKPAYCGFLREFPVDPVHSCELETLCVVDPRLIPL
jgi:hypothetical protein